MIPTNCIENVSLDEVCERQQALASFRECDDGTEYARTVGSP
jgi:hypothetical protein